ncbi:MAG: hypothetical protein QXK26_02285, partial [Candidatus Bathyarchaeia archaeon]
NKLKLVRGSDIATSTGITIDSSGNVGIGTTAPTSKLQVLSSSGSQLRLSYDSANFQDFTVDYTGALQIAQDGGSATLTLSSGKVGIGTSTPSGIFVVATSTLNPLLIDDDGLVMLDDTVIGATTFEVDAGAVVWIDMPVTASSSAGAINSYTAQMVGFPTLTMYSEGDGAGGTQNRRVGFGTTTPAAYFTVATGTTNALVVTSAGRIGIGTTSPAYALVVGNGSTQADVYVPKGGLCVDVDASGCPANPSAGTIYASSTVISGIDLAENYPTTQADLEPGELVAVDPNNPEHIIRTTEAYQRTVIGVISTQPGIKLGQKINNAKPVALAGRVPVKVTAKNGEIKIGDRLTPSDIPGVAMLARANADYKQTNADENSDIPAIGVALDNYSGDGVGVITVFVNLGWHKLDGAVTKSATIGQGWFLGADGRIVSTTEVDFGGNALVNVKSIISSHGKWQLDEFGKMVVEELEVKKRMYLYDEDTGERYCVSVKSGQVTAIKCDHSIYTGTTSVQESSANENTNNSANQNNNNNTQNTNSDTNKINENMNAASGSANSSADTFGSSTDNSGSSATPPASNGTAVPPQPSGDNATSGGEGQ